MFTSNAIEHFNKTTKFYKILTHIFKIQPLSESCTVRPIIWWKSAPLKHATIYEYRNTETLRGVTSWTHFKQFDNGSCLEQILFIWL
jgi:hypothetical protein